jgi:hypothetical protein
MVVKQLIISVLLAIAVVLFRILSSGEHDKYRQNWFNNNKNIENNDNNNNPNDDNDDSNDNGNINTIIIIVKIIVMITMIIKITDYYELLFNHSKLFPKNHQFITTNGGPPAHTIC